MKTIGWVIPLALAASWATGAEAVTLTLSGSVPGTNGSQDFDYGTASNNNNVVNSGTSGLTDTTAATQTEWYMTGTSGPVAKATVSNVSPNGYGVQWWFAGAESGFQITFSSTGNISGSVSKVEANENNNGGVGGGSPGPSALGTTKFTTVADGTAIPFQFNWTDTGSSTPGPKVLANGSSLTDPSIMFAYVIPTSSLSWQVVNFVTNYFAFGLDDGGSDDNHDDWMGVARVFDLNEVGDEVPLPAAFPLFATALAGGGLAGSRKVRAFGRRLFGRDAA